MKKIFKEVFLSNKKITICTILLFVIVIIIASVLSFSAKGVVSAETLEKYGNYKKDSKSTINKKNIEYYINYVDFLDTTNKYSLGVDNNRNYKLIYSKYADDSSRHDSYYFNGTLTETDYNSFIEVIGQMGLYLEGIKSDDNYQFYYNYQDIAEQNENGNRFLKAIMEEFINYTIYGGEGRISNFEEIFKVMTKFSNNPEIDLDAELVFNEKGVIIEATPVEGSEVAEVKDSSDSSSENDQASKSTTTAKSNIPLAKGEKSDVARLDRIIIDFKDNCSEADAFAVIGKIDSGILYRFEQGNKYIITIEECENVEKVKEVCNKIKSENDLVENAEVCYE